MQVIINLCAVFVCLFVIQADRCDKNRSRREDSDSAATTKADSSDSAFRKFRYELVSKDCFKEETCLALVYLEKKYFQSEQLSNLVKYLNQMNPQKARLRIFFFDNLSLAKAFADGRREFRDLETNARGLFFSSPQEEYLKTRIMNVTSENWNGWQIVYSRKPEDE